MPQYKLTAHPYGKYNGKPCSPSLIGKRFIDIGTHFPPEALPDLLAIGARERNGSVYVRRRDFDSAREIVEKAGGRIRERTLKVMAATPFDTRL